MEVFGSFEGELTESTRLDGKNRWSGDAPSFVCAAAACRSPTDLSRISAAPSLTYLRTLVNSSAAIEVALIENPCIKIVIWNCQ